MTRFPDCHFRLGSTSYVFPDGLVPNARQLAHIVSDMELVLFDTPTHSNLPAADAVQQLDAIAREAGMTYTVHLPLDITGPDLTAPDGLSDSVRLAERVMSITAPLRPCAVVAHVDGRAELASGPAADWAQWRQSRIRMLRHLMAQCARPEVLCIENLEGYPIEELLPILDVLPVGFCLDVGHRWLDGLDALAIYRRFQSRIRVIHLHGVGTDAHQSLRVMPAAPIFEFLDELRRSCYDGVLTLEVFGMEDFFSSRDLLLEWAAQCDVTTAKGATK